MGCVNPANPSQKMEMTNKTSTPQNAGNPSQNNQDDDEDVLVTEFPPPPYYFRLASLTYNDKKDGNIDNSSLSLKPPKIPIKALERASKKAAEQREKTEQETERRRLAAEASEVDLDQEKDGGGGTDHALNAAVLGGAIPDLNAVAVEEEQDDDNVVVFGEYVEVSILLCSRDST